METKQRLDKLEALVDALWRRLSSTRRMILDPPMGAPADPKYIHKLAREEAQKVLAEGPLRWLYEPRLVGPLSREEADRLREEDSAKRKLAYLRKWLDSRAMIAEDMCDKSAPLDGHRGYARWKGKRDAYRTMREFLENA